MTYFQILHQITSAYNNAQANTTESTPLVIYSHGSSYSVRISNPNEMLNKTVISQSLENLRNCLGSERLKRIIAKPELKLDNVKFDSNTLVLTKEVMRKIILGFLDVKVEDYADLNSSNYTDYNLYQFDLKTLNSAFLGQEPPLSDFTIDRALSSGKGFRGLVERVFLNAYSWINYKKHSDKIKQEIIVAETLSSQLADREFQEGTIVSIEHTYYCVDKVFVKGGAYVSILKDLKGINPPKLICRGTAARPTSTDAVNTLLNDLQIEIGTKGVKAVWPDLADYLKSNNITHIEIYGKSMGGGQAMAFSVLIEGILNIKIQKLVTFASVGAGHLKDIFNREILSKRAESNPFVLDVLRIAGTTDKETDFIPIVGGVHLGEGVPEEYTNRCQARVIYIQPGEDEVNPFPLNIGFIRRIAGFIRSFAYAHCRQTTLGNFSYKVINDCAEHLRMGLIFERWRLAFAYIIHFFTFGQFNGDSFASFYEAQKKLHTKTLSLLDPLDA